MFAEALVAYNGSDGGSVATRQRRAALAGIAEKDWEIAGGGRLSGFVVCGVYWSIEGRSFKAERDRKVLTPTMYGTALRVLYDLKLIRMHPENGWVTA